MSDYYIYNGELYSADDLAHHGVKGMKWGVRKFETKSRELNQKKVAMKRAKKDYNKAFNKANNRRIAAFSPSKKQRQANDKRWEDAINKADKLAVAKKDYKEAKKEFRQNTTIGQKINRGATKTTALLRTIGMVYATDQVVFGGKGTKIAKAAIVTTGRAAVTAYVMSQGGHDIKWYDRHGRRVG